MRRYMPRPLLPLQTPLSPPPRRRGGKLFLVWAVSIAVIIIDHQISKVLNRFNVSTGFQSCDLYDESYWNLVGNPKDINVIASSTEDGETRPQAWEREYGAGRVFVCIPGHYVWTFDDPIYRAFLLRGICWAAGQPTDSLADLIRIGARVAD